MGTRLPRKQKKVLRRRFWGIDDQSKESWTVSWRQYVRFFSTGNQLGKLRRPQYARRFRPSEAMRLAAISPKAAL